MRDMFTILGVAGCGVVVGVLAGLTGIGGILIPSFMIVLLGMDAHLAMGTSMASYLPSLALAIWSHFRQGNLARSLVLPLSLPGVVCVFAGTELKAYSPGEVLNLLLAVLVIAVGAMTYRPVRVPDGRTPAARDGWLASPAVRLGLLGGAVGVLSGMTGAGGPVLTVPAMIAMGYSPLAAIASGMTYSIAISAVGTVGNALHHSVDFSLAGLCAAGQVAGMWVGLAAARRLDTKVLKHLVAWVCILTGVAILVRTLL